MAIPKNKQRITITIHNETKQLLDELLALHDKSSYSTIIEVALYYYASMLEKGMNQATTEKEKKDHAKN